jgi:CheY-like chemotaxis protein
MSHGGCSIYHISTVRRVAKVNNSQWNFQVPREHHSQHLPRYRASESQHLARSDVFENREGVCVPVRSVLVVDDNPAIRRTLCELFTREGDFDVCGEPENGREAIEKAHLLHPDLIVTDLSMPIMNGLEETRILKNLMPAVPVIIFTAHSDPFVEKEAVAAGASALVSKSEDVSVLIATARSLLDQIAA